MKFFFCIGQEFFSMTTSTYITFLADTMEHIAQLSNRISVYFEGDAANGITGAEFNLPQCELKHISATCITKYINI